MRRNRIVAAVIVVVLVAGVAGYLVWRRDANLPEVRLSDASRGVLADTVTISGRTATSDEADIYPPAPGTLEAVLVDDGESVKAGDVIATMDTEQLETQVTSAEAAYRAAVAQLASIDAQIPTSTDKEAADAAVHAAWVGYEAAGASASQFEDTIAQVSAIETDADLGIDVELPSIEVSETARETYPEVAEALDELDRVLRETEEYLASLSQLDTVDSTLESVKALAIEYLEGQAAAAEAQEPQLYSAWLGAEAQREALDRASDVGPARSAAQAQVDQAAEALRLAEQAVEESTLTAPMDGILVYHTVTSSIAGLESAAGPAAEPGPGFSVSPASAPFSVIRLGALRFVGEVDEADVDSLEESMTAIVRLDAFPDEGFDTYVERVGVVAQSTATGGNAFPVRLPLRDTGRDILVGMRGSAEIATERIEDAVSVPIEAIFEEGDDSVVYVYRDGRVERAPVVIGVYTETRVEILEGLEGDERVVISTTSELEDDGAVRIREEASTGEDASGGFGPFG